jgi:DDE superfamily endonuclease
MTQNRIESAAAQPTVPTILISWLAVFRPCFTAPVWNHILVLVAGAVLAPGKRTVTQALRVMGLAHQPGFGRYHEVLNRARWDARDVARRLLLHLLAVLSPSGEVVIGVDDTIERRWGSKIKARGIYRDAVRSSHGHFVKTSGLRWLSLAVMVPVPFAGRRWALPFLTVLAPSARWSEAQGRRHKALTDWARLAILQTLAAGSPRGCRRRQRFLGIGTHRRGAPARLLHHQVASRRQFVRAGTQTPKGPNGTTCTERQTPAQTQRRPHRSENCMDIRHAN